MLKKSSYFLLFALCGILSLSGCRKKAPETETQTETETETQSETQTEKATEKQTEKPVQKTTEKQTASKNNTKTTEKTTVKPSTINSNNTTGTTSNSNNTTTAADSYGTQQCPYCYQQISLAPNGDGTTVYSVHVAQEQAWAETYGYGDQPGTATQQTPQDTTQQPANDSAQCGYCYQWFTVSDGSYAAHIAAENAALGIPEGTEYIQCPICGYSYPKGNLYDNHVCVTN